MFEVYKVRAKVDGEDKIFGGLPKGEVFERWVESKQIPEDIAEENRQDTELAEEIEAGLTVFRRDEAGLFLRNFQLKACLKEATQRLGYWKKHRGLRGHMQTGMFIKPRKIYFQNSDGETLKEAVGWEEAQGRVYTPQGYKSILRKSEYVTDVRFEFEIHLLPFHGFGKNQLVEVLELMQWIGLGSWRSREEGKFGMLEFVAVTAHGGKTRCFAT
jgi:hypothetical protein